MSELRAADPRRLGAYRLSGRLGQGGQGVVYLGHTGNGAQVAIKLLHASLSADPAVRRRFLAEVEAVRRVAPFCTAQLLDADLEGDRPYLVSEYVDGISLREHVIAKGPRTGGSLHRLAIGTATALGAIHRAAVVHRDFKPGNVLLSLDGPRVIDFGVSRLMDSAATTGSIPLGTPAYLSPERIKGEPAGPAADLYAWALTVAYTATGRHAYTADTHQEVLARILYGKPDLGTLTGRLRELVDACLAPEPGDRPDAEEVLRRLLNQDMTGDVLSTGAMAAVDITGPPPGRSPGRPATTVGDADPDHPSETDDTTAPTAPPAGVATVAWRVRGPGSSGGSTGSRSALAALVDTSASTYSPAPTPSGPARGPVSTPSPSPDARSSPARAQTRELPALGPARPPATGTPGNTGSTGSTAGRVRRRPKTWQLAVLAAGLAIGIAAWVFWSQGAGGPGLEGTWTGSAEHPGAERVFPVEIRLAGERDSSMRWGADLHCSGRLSGTAREMVFELGDVKGEECHPGTLRIQPTADADQMAISVIRQGEQEVAYSGTISRTS
ncbi:protein kinase domain-containing protein [Nonomuraea sp. LPB2021202275-12-8]|uniref:protein kinase domain-containing protein n=1 Tax=Nonomuraea sp. LPB2021202275-12-8 TaxID=3120159 RepID=UPI00300D5711